jgi:hypothetical protein
MFAIVAAVIFGIAFLLDLLNVPLPSALSDNLFLFLGLTFVALHLAGIGTSVRYRRRR